MESIPGGDVRIAVPKSVFWIWVGATFAGALTVIGFLIRLAFGLEADLIRAQSEQGTLIKEIKDMQDHELHVDGVLFDHATRLAAIEAVARFPENRTPR